MHEKMSGVDEEGHCACPTLAMLEDDHHEKS